MIPKVSVIVPIYNTERYLARCLDSLLGQSLEHLEIVLVLDGKTNDESRVLAESYTKRDQRIKLIEEAGYGVSAVRNIGLRNALGDYIAFVDSDDYVMPEMFSTLYLFASGQSLDISVSGIYRDNDDSAPPHILKQYSHEISRVDTTSRLLYIYKWVLSSQANPIWNKLYNRQFLLRHGLQFDEAMKMGEDAAFNSKCFALANAAGSMPQAFYVYFNRKSSQTYSVNTLDTMQDFQRRWLVFVNMARTLPDGNKLLAIVSLRLIANAVLLFKTRNQSLTDACEFAEEMIVTLRLQSHLETSLMPGVIDEFARASHMDETASANFFKFATAARAGKHALLEWQLYYQNTLEKKG